MLSGYITWLLHPVPRVTGLLELFGLLMCVRIGVGRECRLSPGVVLDWRLTGDVARLLIGMTRSRLTGVHRSRLGLGEVRGLLVVRLCGVGIRVWLLYSHHFVAVLVGL